MEANPNKARLLFKTLAKSLWSESRKNGSNAETIVYNDNHERYCTSPFSKDVAGSIWDGSQDQVTLTILPNSTIDTDPSSKDTILFKAEGEDTVYHVSEFQEQRRGYVGHVTYQLSSDKKGRKT